MFVFFLFRQYLKVHYAFSKIIIASEGSGKESDDVD